MGSPPAPATISSRLPLGIKYDDGFRTLIIFNANPTVSLWEKVVKPPGLEGGDPIETTTMHNTALRTFAPRKLKTMTNSTMTCAYEERVFTQLLALIDVETTVTIVFPDDATIAFYGFLQTFDPQDNEEGTQPEASCVIVPTNQDPVDGTEQNFVLTANVGS